MKDSKIKGARIAILSVHSSPLGKPGAKDTGGMSTYILEAACELAKFGLAVDIYTRIHSPGEKGVSDVAPGVRLIHLKAGDDKDLDKLLVFSYLPDFACNVEGFRKQNSLKYDLVFSHYWLSGVVGQTLKTWWRVPHLIMFHTLGAIKNSLGIGEDEPELRIATEGQLARGCDRVIASTEGEKIKLTRHYGAPQERIRVIPCGVNMERFHPEDKIEAKRRLGLSDNKVILFVGRIEALKGIDNLIKAMPYVHNGSKPRLVIVGGDEQSDSKMKRLKKLTDELGIAGSVSFSGLVDYGKMPDFYSAADVCVVPSYYESFGLVALEALACGTPVVATDVGDLKNIIIQSKTGYVVEENTPFQLADKIGAVLSHQSAEGDSKQLIRSSVSGLSWANTAKSLVKVFEEVMREKNREKINEKG